MPTNTHFSADQSERLRGRLEAVRRHFGGNSAACARALGVSQAHVLQAVRGARSVGFAVAAAVARFHGISIEQLLSDVEPPWPCSSGGGPAEDRPTSPADDRGRLPDLWQAYDDAGNIALDLKDHNHVLAAVAADVDAWAGTCEAFPLQHATGRTVVLLTLLRTLLRERIQSGKGGAR